MNKFSLFLILPALLSMPFLSAREGTEWDQAYWYNANDSKLPRVLLLGDSICNGYQTLVRDELAGVAYVSFWATSKNLGDKSFLKMLAYILDEYPYTVVHFNNGLHSASMQIPDYVPGLQAALKLIREKAKGAKIIWVSSTPTREDSPKIREMNALAAAMAKVEGLPINDLYGLMDPLDRAKYWVDNYHFSGDARKIQAKRVSAMIREAMGGATATADEARKALAGAANDMGPDGKVAVPKAPLPATALVDGDFELKTGWTIYPGQASNGSIQYIEGGAHGGKGYGKVTAITRLELVQSRPKLEPGATYRFSFWAKAEAPLKVQASVRTIRPPYAFAVSLPADLTTEWKEYSATFTAPADYQADKFTFLLGVAPGNTVSIDDVTFEKK